MGTKWPPAENFPRQRYIRVFCGLAGPHGNYVVSDETCSFIRDSVISVILACVNGTSRKLRCIRRNLFFHPRQHYIRDSCLC